MPIADRELLESLGYKEKIRKADEAIIKNAEFLNNIVANPEIFGHDLEADIEEDHETGNEPTVASPDESQAAGHGP